MEKEECACDKHSATKDWDRFDEPLGIIEFEIGKHLIHTYFPRSGKICDIGGGPGRYSEFLARSGYEVTLSDGSQELIRIAEEKLAKSYPNVSDLICAPAMNLPFADNSYDGGLMMGPMYQLIEEQDRLKALGELYRVLKPGARAIITYFGSYGMLRLGIADLVDRYEQPAEIERFLGPTSFPDVELKGFTVCHFSVPGVIQEELTSASFQLVSYASGQSFAGGIRLALERMCEINPKAFYRLLEVLIRHCEDKRWRDLGQHLHFVVCKEEKDS